MPVRLREKIMKKPTVIEYIVIAAIVSVLVAILFPVFSRVRMYSGPGCSGTMRQLGLAMSQYAQDNDNCLPPLGDATGRVTWRTEIYPYVKSMGTYSCPERVRRSVHMREQRASDGFPISYAANTAGVWRSGPGRGPFAPTAKPVALSGIDDPTKAIALCEVQKTASAGFDIDDPFFGPSRQVLYAGHRGGSNYMLCDGHVKWMLPGDTNDLSGASRNMWYSGNKGPLSRNGQEILKQTAAAFPVTED